MSRATQIQKPTRPAAELPSSPRRGQILCQLWLAGNRHNLPDLPFDSRPLPSWPVLNFRSGEGVPPPPQIYILYLYGYLKRGQNEGIFRAFEDELRFTERSRLAINCLWKTVCSAAAKRGAEIPKPGLSTGLRSRSRMDSDLEKAAALEAFWSSLGPPAQRGAEIPEVA